MRKELALLFVVFVGSAGPVLAQAASPPERPRRCPADSIPRGDMCHTFHHMHPRHWVHTTFK